MPLQRISQNIDAELRRMGTSLSDVMSGLKRYVADQEAARQASEEQHPRADEGGTAHDPNSKQLITCLHASHVG
jgi:hypothetical protein